MYNGTKNSSLINVYTPDTIGAKLSQSATEFLSNEIVLSGCDSYGTKPLIVCIIIFFIFLFYIYIYFFTIFLHFIYYFIFICYYFYYLILFFLFFNELHCYNYL